MKRKRFWIIPPCVIGCLLATSGGAPQNRDRGGLDWLKQLLGDVSKAGLYANYTIDSPYPPSSVFCGNLIKRGPCLNGATDSAGRRFPAREKVEVRGWIMDSGGFTDTDRATVNQEYYFTLLMDE